jgi:hypothetical protein
VVLQKVILLINALCVFVISLCLWEKILLPYSYIFTVIVLAVLLAFSIVKDGVNSKIVIFQLFLIFFLIRNVFYLSTKNVIPFGDAYWDYAVEKTFLQQGQITTIEGIVRPTEAGGISQLTWYSGWPFLHTFGISFSFITGLDPVYLNLILSNFLGLISFVFIYLTLEKFRVKMNLPKGITFIALLLYIITPEAIFWQMQFVRQSFALVLLIPIIYFLYILTCEKPERKYYFILGLLILSLVFSHHVTALILALFLLIFPILNIIGNVISGWRKLKWIYSPINSKLFLGFGGLAFIAMFLWWLRNSTTIIPTITSRIILFFENFGMERAFSAGLAPQYPSIIRPFWVPLLLGLRDLLIYVPAAIGFVILWRKQSDPPKFFISYSLLSFGILFIVNVVFSIEPLRIILFMAPFLAFLSSLVYNRIQQISKNRGKIILFSGLVLLVFSSFMGLWAHSFAPIHLYDPSVNPVEIGEATPDFMRLKPFFENYINMSNFEEVRADVIARLVYLLDPEEFDKIKSLPAENLDQIDREDALICSFNDLNLYLYYGYIWSPIEASEAKVIQKELNEYINNNFNRIYSDGSSILWVS